MVAGTTGLVLESCDDVSSDFLTSMSLVRSSSASSAGDEGDSKRDEEECQE
jgi:hypothetical protein